MFFIYKVLLELCLNVELVLFNKEIIEYTINVLNIYNFFYMVILVIILGGSIIYIYLVLDFVL